MENISDNLNPCPYGYSEFFLVLGCIAKLLTLRLGWLIVFCLQVAEPVVKHSVHTLVFRSLKRSHDMFIHHDGLLVPEDDLGYVDKYALAYSC